MSSTPTNSDIILTQALFHSQSLMHWFSKVTAKALIPNSTLQALLSQHYSVNLSATTSVMCLSRIMPWHKRPHSCPTHLNSLTTRLMLVCFKMVKSQVVNQAPSYMRCHCIQWSMLSMPIHSVILWYVSTRHITQPACLSCSQIGCCNVTVPWTDCQVAFWNVMIARVRWQVEVSVPYATCFLYLPIAWL